MRLRIAGSRDFRTTRSWRSSFWAGRASSSCAIKRPPPAKRSLPPASAHLTRAVGALLIINDHVDVVLDIDADGVHLGQEDLQVEEARAMLGPNKIIGLSTHSLDQFRAGLATSADYLAVGPVYATSTKENPSPVVGLELLRKVRDLGDRPVVAIGGITPELAPAVIAAGADTIAVVSALYPPPDTGHPDAGSGIPSRVRAFLEALKDEGPIGQVR